MNLRGFRDTSLRKQKDGTLACSESGHFRGCAREVYRYMKLLARNHGGFVFASISNIAKHAKKWHTATRFVSQKERPLYSKREVERVITALIKAGVLEPKTYRTVHRRRRAGWQMRPHSDWTKIVADTCCFRVEILPDLQHQNVAKTRENVTQSVTQDVAKTAQDVAKKPQNVAQNVVVSKPESVLTPALPGAYQWSPRRLSVLPGANEAI